MNILTQYGKVFIILIFSYLLFGFFATITPNALIKKNIQKSVKNFEVIYPKTIIHGKAFLMDNYTDALILNQVYCLDSNNPINSTLLLFRYEGASRDVIESLQKVCTQACTPNRTYGRYWHGNTFLTKFLLYWGHYDTIRYFLYVCTSFLFFLCLYLLVKRINLYVAFCFFISYTLTNFFVTQFSIQFAPVQIICLVMSIAILLGKDSNRNTIIFFIGGSLVAYFDLLTTPIISLGIPLCIYALLYLLNIKSFIQQIKQVFFICTKWTIGYAMTWITKWGLATIITNKNIFEDAGLKIAERSQTSEHFTRFEVIAENFKLLPVSYIVVSLIILLFIAIFFYKKGNLKNSFLLLIISTLPYVWIFFVANHSWVHWWFTYRIQVVALFTLFCAIGININFQKIKEKSLYIKERLSDYFQNATHTH